MSKKKERKLKQLSLFDKPKVVKNEKPKVVKKEPPLSPSRKAKTLEDLEKNVITLGRGKQNGTILTGDQRMEIMAALVQGYSIAQVSRLYNINETTVRSIRVGFEKKGITVPEEVIEYVRNKIVQKTVKDLNRVRTRYGQWAVAMSEDLYDITQNIVFRLNTILQPTRLDDGTEVFEELSKNDLNTVHRLTQAFHSLIGDVAVMVGMPTNRTVNISEENDPLNVPEVSKAELAESLEALAESIREDKKTG